MVTAKWLKKAREYADGNRVMPPAGDVRRMLQELLERIDSLEDDVNSSRSNYDNGFSDGQAECDCGDGDDR